MASPTKIDDWEVRSDLDTLLRAAEIQKDPARMSRIRKLAASKVAAMESISGKLDADDKKGK
jgi:hypothetical protein